MVEHVLCGDDRDDPGGAQILHHGVQRQVAVLAQELVRVACKIGELFISHYSLSKIWVFVKVQRRNCR